MTAPDWDIASAVSSDLLSGFRRVAMTESRPGSAGPFLTPNRWQIATNRCRPQSRYHLVAPSTGIRSEVRPRGCQAIVGDSDDAVAASMEEDS